MIFQRKNKGRKANPRGAGNKDRQGKVGGGQSRRFCGGDDFPKEKQGPQSQSPRSGERIAHAKVAKAAKARILDVFPRLRDALTRGFLIGEEIAHAKPRQEYGVESLRSERGAGKA